MSDEIIELSPHEEAVNEFIPVAEAYANKHVKPSKTQKWTRTYMDKMNELTIAAGLRVHIDESSVLVVR